VADDTLILLFLCCHPALSPASQIALTLRAVGGLSTTEIARAFLVPEATMTRRITRAKQTVKDSGIPFALPARDERASRLAAVLHALYLIFTEGYAATTGPGLIRPDLSAEAIRLTRILHRLLPGNAEVTGMLALMLHPPRHRLARSPHHGRRRQPLHPRTRLIPKTLPANRYQAHTPHYRRSANLSSCTCFFVKRRHVVPKNDQPTQLQLQSQRETQLAWMLPPIALD
jgi:hypothetical protein